MNIQLTLFGLFSCAGKVKYGHMQTAQRAADVMTVKKAEPFEAYKCRHCDRFHIGHPKGWKWRNNDNNNSQS